MKHVCNMNTHRRYIGSLSLQSKIKSHINNKDEKNTRSRCLYSFKHSTHDAHHSIFFDKYQDAVLSLQRYVPVSYTHLDVYKRQRQL